MHKIKGNAIHIGDININLLDSSLQMQNYSNLLSNHGFISAMNMPTRITTVSKRRIDHIFIRYKDSSSFKSARFDIEITDHCLLGLTLIASKHSFNNKVIKDPFVKIKIESTEYKLI